MDQAVKEVRRPLSDADRKAVQALLAGDKSLPAKLKANPNSRGCTKMSSRPMKVHNDHPTPRWS
jgi:hypothetical protein